MQELELESEDLQAALKTAAILNNTEEDLKTIFKIALKHAKERIALKIPVSDVMTKDVITIKKNAGLHEAAGLLSENKISGMPVIDEENHVIGIVTEADILCMAGIKSDHTTQLFVAIFGGMIERATL